ncbi:site-specific integrase [Lactobacillus delbrueckii]|uniref:site-specific integrase n=1 Tax=Lactobacillus delbrueckii TaxID=1584 RepID=UPI001E607B5F|nr:site-specific integrase [Lactobacillus delbrueckii]MCD5514046.1 site-specific integrase [Lactobacillus delbrueckii subsp. lactis]MCT3501716.1 site-specific integrase [Lactobacillus delbrueckii subsp. lactis]
MNKKDIIKYQTASGKDRYKFIVYAGKDETTGKSIIIRKQGFKTLKEAKQAYLDVQQAILNGDYLPINQKRLTYKGLLELYLPLYAQTVKETSFYQFKRCMESKVLPALGDVYLDKITPQLCQKAVNQWAKEYPVGFERVTIWVSKVLKYAFQIGLIDNNPFDRVIKPKKPAKKKKDNFYTKNELESFLNGARDAGMMKYTLFRLLAFSGMRIGELIALEWSDVDFFRKTVSINKTLTLDKAGKSTIGSPKTASSNRTIMLDDETMNALQKWRAEQSRRIIYLGKPKNDLIFPNEHGEHFSSVTVTNWNKKIAEKQGLRKIGLHGFRHTHASLCFEAGLTMQDVKERLGHSNISTTMDIYTHVTKSRKEESVQQLAKFMRA